MHKQSAFKTLGALELEKEAMFQGMGDGMWNKSIKPTGQLAAATGKQLGKSVGGFARAGWNIATSPFKALGSAVGGAWKGAQKGGLGGAMQGAWDAGSKSMMTDIKDTGQGLGAGFKHGLGGLVAGVGTGAMLATAPLSLAYGGISGAMQKPKPRAPGQPATPGQPVTPGQPATPGVGPTTGPVTTAPQQQNYPIPYDPKNPANSNMFRIPNGTSPTPQPGANNLAQAQPAAQINNPTRFQ